MNSYEPLDAKPSGFWARTVKIALALVIAILVGFAMRWAYHQWASAETKNNVDQTVTQLQIWVQEQFVATKAKGKELSDKGVFDFNGKQREKEKREAEAKRQRELQAAKEAAWEKFYKPRPECAHPYSDAQFVECGNEYHRAKVKFEEMWQARTK